MSALDSRHLGSSRDVERMFDRTSVRVVPRGGHEKSRTPSNRCLIIGRDATSVHDSRVSDAAAPREATSDVQQGPGAPRRARGRSRPDPAPAQGARGDPRLGPAARLPAVDAGDRRGGRADQHLQRRPTSSHAAAQGLPAPRPEPPARGGGPAAGHPAVRPEPRSRTRPRLDIAAQPTPAYVPLVGRIAAGGPILAEQSRRGRLPAAQAARRRGHAVPAEGGRRLDDRRRHRRRRLGRRAPAAGRRERRHRRGHDRRRGHRQDVQAHATATSG